MTSEQLFKDFLFDFFIEWEKRQPGRRSTYTAFANWLSDNSMGVEIKQQNVDSWMKGTIPKDHKFVMVLAEKLGDEIYELLNFKKPNPYLQRVNRVWEFIPEAIQKRIAEDAEKYEETNELSRVSTAHQRRKTRKVE
jgi:hypothetical protein